MDSLQYVNPDYQNEVAASMVRVASPQLIAAMTQVQQLPTAVWLDRIDAIKGGQRNHGRLSLESHLEQALAQQRQKKRPVVVPLVIYNLPNRDCAAFSSNGSLDAHHGGLEQYKHRYIDTIAAVVAQPRFASLRIVMILEPDSLPNMVTNLDHPICQWVADQQVYARGIQYAIKRFRRLDNSYLYLDIAHSGWLGWPDARQRAVSYYRTVILGAKDDQGLEAIDGFVTNISGATPVEEIWLPYADQLVGDQPVKSADFYGWNPLFDEKDYVEQLYDDFIAAGFPRKIRFLIDTSRNGWGGDARPLAVSSLSSSELNRSLLNEYVDASRIDQRSHRGYWCNPKGAGLGARPVSNPYGADHPVAAFVWVKPPGESDGTSDATQQAEDAEGKRYDQTCDPNFTDAMANAPAAGHWFHEQFLQLIQNAEPPLVQKSE
ncbi:MAG: glycoside hydrolase family 6 protein [Zetaproteobacteria bacterium]|nr:glycoside hydrolase family 6 protein [Zetaproteobacteria bacterium]